MNPRRLTFDSHVFHESSIMAAALQNLPSVRRALFVDGVPKGFIGRRYSVDPGVTILSRQETQPILRFGSSGLNNAVGVDLATGNVVEVIAAPAFPTLFVNESILQFTRTVKAMIDRFPYYDRDASYEDMHSIACELLDIIRDIDFGAAAPDKYWSTFVDDVEIGDLSTEAVLALDE